MVVDVRGTFVPGRAASGPAAGSVLMLVPQDAYVVKRLLAGPGQRVTCCDADGHLLVDGEALDEPYLAGSGPASQVAFDVVVPDDRWWLMGDNRAVSDDSRSHLGSPGGGTVATDVIVGRVAAVL